MKEKQCFFSDCKKEARGHCGGCHRVYYCSQKCQRLHWRINHKIVCLVFREHFHNKQNNSIVITDDRYINSNEIHSKNETPHIKNNKKKDISDMNNDKKKRKR